MKLALQTGATAFATFAISAAIYDCADAHASEVPPAIDTSRGAIPAGRRSLADEARSPAPGAVPICEGPIAIALDDDIPERAIVERHLASCSRAGPHSDPFAVLAIVRLEADLGTPPGMLSSIACWETGYRADARGDWLDGVARAHGIAQLHPWAYAPSKCGLAPGGRDDVDASLRCYWSRVEARLAETQGCADPLTVAEALVANVVKYRGWKCRARSLHAVEWARWGLR